MSEQTTKKATKTKRDINEQTYILTKEHAHDIIARHLEDKVIKGKANVTRLTQRGNEITITYIHSN